MNTGKPPIKGKTQAAPARPTRAKTGKQVSKSRKKVDAIKPKEKEQLPALVELIYTTAAVIVVAVSLIVMVVSLISGVTLVDLLIRTSVTILGVGALALIIAWQVASGVIKAGIDEIEEEEKQKAEEAKKAKEEKETEEDWEDPFGEGQPAIR